MISFKANLKVNKDIYKNLKNDNEISYVEGVVDKYKKFLEIHYIKKLSEGDTIELKKGKYRGYSLELKITNDNMEEPFITGVYTTKKEPTIRCEDLNFQTLLYLCHKKGEKPKLSESSIRYVKRVLFPWTK